MHHYHTTVLLVYTRNDLLLPLFLHQYYNYSTTASHPCIIICLLYIHVSYVCYISMHLSSQSLLPAAEYHSGAHVGVVDTCWSLSGYLLLAPHTQRAFVGSYTTSVMTWASSSSKNPLLMMHIKYTIHITCAMYITYLSHTSLHITYISTYNIHIYMSHTYNMTYEQELDGINDIIMV